MATKWTLDAAHSEIEFKVRHMMITNMKGSFESFTADIDGDDFATAPITVTINTSGISTGNTDRDNHLKSADFFDAEAYPEIVFKSKKMENTGGYEYKLTGDLTMKGVTKEVTLHVEYGGTNKDPWGNDKAGFSVDGKINRKDWGLNWNAALEAGGVMVSEEVKIHAEVQFVKQS